MPTDKQARPLSLSDTQMTALMDAAGVFPSAERAAFLERVALQFAGRETVGDGEWHRALAAMQRAWFRAPLEADERIQRAPHHNTVRRGWLV